MAVAAALLGAVGAAHASPPLAVSWAQLKLKTAKVSPACVDSNSGGPKVDVYACVAPTAGNIDNELFALSATGQWLARACGLPSGRCPPTQTPKCVSPVACSGAASGLCLARCGNDTRWQKQGGAAGFALSPLASPGKCVALVGGALSVQPCSAALRFVWGPKVTPPPPPPPPAPLSPVTLHLDGHTASHSFDGHGLLSAGASSRLLRDYAEPQRSQILDFLFKPQFGASLDIIKVEIGGDCQSTSGTEASHMHSRHDLGCHRGYEGMLLAEAKKRNPSIKTWGLSWGVPAWISQGSFNSSSYFTQDNIRYQTQWLKCIKETTGIVVDYIGIWNERSYGPVEYTIALRKSFDAAGFHATKIVLPDNPITQTLVNQLNTDKAFDEAIYALGTHECGRKTWQGSFSQKEWCAESEVSNGWGAAKSWGPTLNQNFIGANQTSTTSWSLIWSVPEALSPYQNRGAMMASTPWSGHYFVDATVWMHAHWTQVTEPGWEILGVEGGGSGYIDGSSWQNGTYCTIVSPDATDFSVVIERLPSANGYLPVTLILSNLGAAADKPLSLWVTSESNWFQLDMSQRPRKAADGSVKLLLLPGAIYSLTTLTTVKHGGFVQPVPPPAPFALPYTDTFDSYANDSLPRYLADQGGSFSVIKNGTDGGGVLQQMTPTDPGPNGWVANQDPITLVGDLSWTDISVSALAKLSLPDSPAPPLHESQLATAAEERVAVAPLQLLPCLEGVPEQVWVPNTPFKGYFQNAETKMCLNQFGCGKDVPVIQYRCIPPGSGSQPTCENEIWALTPSKQLVINVTGQCATTHNQGADHRAIMTDCISPVPLQQQWELGSGGQLRSAIGNQYFCLSTPPIQRYVAVCARISAFDAFAGFAANNGVCLRLIANGTALSWSMRESTTILASGPITGGTEGWRLRAAMADADGWHKLELTVVGRVATATINGVKLGSVPITNATRGGSASLGSSYDTAFFDNLSVTTAAPA